MAYKFLAEQKIEEAYAYFGSLEPKLKLTRDPDEIDGTYINNLLVECDEAYEKLERLYTEVSLSLNKAKNNLVYQQDIYDAALHDSTMNDEMVKAMSTGPQRERAARKVNSSLKEEVNAASEEMDALKTLQGNIKRWIDFIKDKRRNVNDQKKLRESKIDNFYGGYKVDLPNGPVEDDLSRFTQEDSEETESIDDDDFDETSF